MVDKQAYQVIDRYIKAYNAFDVDGMINLLDQAILFRNYANGKLTTEINGIDAFRALADQSAAMFSSRCQTVSERQEVGNAIEVKIDYVGKLAIDLPNGLKAGDTLALKGKSIITIQEGRITRLEDYA